MARRRERGLDAIAAMPWPVGVVLGIVMYGLLAHHDADAVKVVAVGGYTPDALRFAQGKPIELVHGEALLALITSVQDAPHLRRDLIEPALPPLPNDRPCPRCNAPMVRRESRRTKESFWG